MKTFLILSAALAVVYASTYETYDFPLVKVDSLGDESVTFICDGWDIPENSTAQFWILPNLENTNDTWSKENVFVSDDQMELNVTNAEQSDFGTYFCVVLTDEGITFMQKYGLNLKGPYFEDLGEKYDQNVVIAFSAMISFVLSCVYIGVVYKFSYFKRMGPRVQPDFHEMDGIEQKDMEFKPSSNGAANGELKHREGSKNDGFEKDEDMESARL